MVPTTPTATDQVRWVDLLTEYKYRPKELVSLLDSREDVRSPIQAGLVGALRTHKDWPPELRRWQLVLVALMEIEIGGIWSPYLRAASHHELLADLGNWGITPTALRMASVEADAIYKSLQDQILALPQDWRLPSSGKDE